MTLDLNVKISGMVKTEQTELESCQRGSSPSSASKLLGENADLELPDDLVWFKEERNLDVYMEFLNFLQLFNKMAKHGSAAFFVTSANTG